VFQHLGEPHIHARVAILQQYLLPGYTVGNHKVAHSSSGMNMPCCSCACPRGGVTLTLEEAEALIHGSSKATEGNAPSDC
jgi:hypothetical protein